MNTKDIVIIPPKISDETMKRMAEFFMKTSVPRILRQKTKEGDTG